MPEQNRKCLAPIERLQYPRGRRQRRADLLRQRQEQRDKLASAAPGREQQHGEKKSGEDPMADLTAPQLDVHHDACAQLRDGDALVFDRYDLSDMKMTGDAAGAGEARATPPQGSKTGRGGTGAARGGGPERAGAEEPETWRDKSV